jgi:hypothetical protein
LFTAVITPAPLLLLARAEGSTPSFRASELLLATVVFGSWVLSTIAAASSTSARSEETYRVLGTPMGGHALAAGILALPASVLVLGTFWVPLAASAVLGLTAGGCLSIWLLAAFLAATVALVVMLLNQHLPRSLAVPLSGAWLLASSTPSIAAQWGILAFPVSPALALTDESMRFGNVMQALGSLGTFDAGLLLLLFALHAVDRR